MSLILGVSVYTTPISSMISGHTIPHYLYADDSQLYVSFASGDSAATLNGLVVFGLCPVMDVNE